MRRSLVGLLTLTCAACGDAADGEIRDDQAVAMVEEANSQVPPIDPVVPEPILYPDIEANDIYGASCAYAPGTSLGARAIAREADAFMKVDGEIVRFAADPGARELPHGTRGLYNGRKYTLRLEVEGEGEQPGSEAVEYEGTMQLLDPWGRTVFQGTGTVQCSA